VTRRTPRRTRILLLILWSAVGTIGIVQRITAAEPEHETQGYASWYAGKFQGRLTANGEVFDTNELTAAHRTLPFGTVVEVRHLGNDRTVEVRINDRGPFVEGRVIDLSRAAAEELRMTAQGVAPVRLRVLAEPPPPVHRVQVGSFSSPENARRVRDRLRAAGLAAQLEPSGDVHRVVVPGVPLEELAGTLERLSELGHPDVLVRVEQVNSPRRHRAGGG